MDDNLNAQSLWMLFASFAFAIMGVGVKLASSFYSTSEIVMYRGVIGVLFMYGLVQYRGGTLRTALPLQHLWRGFVGVTSLWLWFYAIGKLPLATAVTLNYLSPIWIAIILFVVSWWRGHVFFEWRLIVAILFSFVGVILLLRPSMHAEQWLGNLFALVSSFLAALAYLQVRRLGQLGEPDYRVVFYFSATGMMTGLLGSLPGIVDGTATLWHVHTGVGILCLLTIGVSATAAQMAMTRAYRLGKTLVTANLQYTGIIFASLWSVLLWDDVLGWSGWLGIVTILASGIAATVYNVGKVKPEPISGTPIMAITTDSIASEL